jgi:hypothetical protein
MKPNLIKGLIIAGVFGLFILIFFCMGISYNNTDIDLRTRGQAQGKVCEAYYDKLWKIIQQKAQVATSYRDDFKSIYPQLIQGRYGNEKGGPLFKFIQESNPNFDITLYRELSQAIESERTGYFHEQEMLIDIKREHDAYIKKAPARWFIGDTSVLKITIITSTQTDSVYKTGKEDNIDLNLKSK